MSQVRSLNRVILVGRAGKDPEITVVASTSRQLAKFSLATNEGYFDKNSNAWKDLPTEWHNIVAWGPLAQPIQLPAYLKGQTMIGPYELPTYRLVLVVFGAAVISALWLTFERTLFGTRIRAAVDNGAMAQAIGINTNWLFAVTFGLGTGLAALGGGLGADILAIVPAYPLQHIVYFMIVVAVGGLGSIRGPFIAALAIGLADTACKYLVTEMGAVFVFALVFALLLWRPNGIVGRR